MRNDTPPPAPSGRGQAAPDAPPAATDPGQSLSPGTPERPARIKQAARFVLATDAWSREVRHLANRLRFPLARKVIGDELRRNQAAVMLVDIPDEVLGKTHLGHVLLMIAMGFAFIWSLILMTKGLTAAFKFGIFFNTWLISSIPLLLFSALRFRLSWITCKLVSEEACRRELSNSKSGAANAHGGGHEKR